MFRITLLLLALVKFGQIANAQNDFDDYAVVLKTEKIDSAFIFDRSTIVKNQKDTYINNLTYIGATTTTKGKTYKFINSFLVVGGLSPKGHSRLLVFNNDNQYLGCYHMGMPEDLPERLDNGYLIFKDDSGSCDKGIRLKLNLTKGLPKEFFLPCNGNMGDFYKFY